MAMFEWIPEIAIGNEVIDNEHKHLIKLLNTAYEAIDIDNIAVTLILDELLEYTQYHFKHEEELMEELNYPYLEQHKSEHAEFCRIIFEKRDEFRAGKPVLTSDLMVFLCAIIRTISHIRRSR